VAGEADLLGGILPAICALVVSFAVTFLLVPIASRFMRRHRIVGADVHKPDRPLIPEMCGVAVVLSVTVSTLIVWLFYTQYIMRIVTFVAATVVAAIVGALDRLTKIGPRLKPVLIALGAAPILILAVYVPYPSFPFIGGTRLTIIYPILIPIALAVTANSVNMLDVFNGSMSGTCSVAVSAIIICMFIRGSVEAASLAAGLLGGLLAFHLYNRYPARVFAGDVGSLYVGAAIGVLAILGRVEVATVTAMMPQIMNAFYGLAAVGRLYERKEISTRPVKMLSDGRLEANMDSRAPITLARMILAGGPLREYEITRHMVSLSVVSAILAVMTQLLTV
jgi:UDP-N-acetylmuramyl pentapeptide phosphotransferase/UDP-N-acetylglucosamine-1-phosphate transferase